MTDESAVPSSASEVTTARVPELEPRQRALVQAISKKDERLAKIYFGGCLSLLTQDNPKYLQMAAYCFRELIDKMALYLDLPVPVEPPGLKGMVNELMVEWTKVERRRAAGQDDSGQIAGFLKRVEAFFSRFRETTVTRVARTELTLQGIDPSGGYMPPPIKKFRVSEWLEYEGYFNSVLHHGREPTEEEFLGWVSSFESFLLSYFRPPTFEEYEGIDAIIAEGEADA